MKTIKIKRYKGFGLIDAVIAIAISAIIAVLFMQVMIQEIVDMKKIEDMDQMSKTSVGTSEYVIRIADKNNGRAPSSPMVFPDIFLNPGLKGKCFIVNPDLASPSFRNLAGDCSYDAKMVDCRKKFPASEKIFSVYCISDFDVQDNKTVVIGKVVSGITNCTTDCKTPDFEYTFIVNINSPSMEVFTPAPPQQVSPLVPGPIPSPVPGPIFPSNNNKSRN